MGLTCLGLVQAALYDIGITPPTSITGTSSEQLQIKNLLYAQSRFLRNQRIWPQCKRTHEFALIAGHDKYQLPEDFYAGISATQWDTSSKFPLLGPLSDADFDWRLYGTVTFENRVAFRIFGPDILPSASSGGQFMVSPKPTTVNDNVAFDYQTKTMFLPMMWQAGAPYATAGEKISANGYIYTFQTAGTAGTVPPNHRTRGDAVGVAVDNTVVWAFVPAWTTLTVYNIGDYVQANSKVYLVTVAGVSGAVAPSHTSGTVVNGTVSFEFQSTPAAWAAGTEYTQASSYVTVNSKFYRCIVSGVSANIANNPNFTATIIGENGATNAPRWTYQKAAQETIPDTGGDSYLSLFDDDIMIEGLKWRYQQSKNLDFSVALANHESLLDSARSRWAGSYKVSLAVPAVRVPSPNIAEGSWTIGNS
jgi:hypothetical protein